MLEAVSLFFLPQSYKLLLYSVNHCVAFSSHRVQLYLPFREFEDWLFVYEVLAYKILKVSFILSLKQAKVRFQIVLDYQNIYSS